MKFLRVFAATLAAACLTYGCATRTIIVGQPRPPISPEAVHVYQVPPRCPIKCRFPTAASVVSYEILWSSDCAGLNGAERRPHLVAVLIHKNRLG